MGKYSAGHSDEEIAVTVILFPERISIGATSPGNHHTPTSWAIKDIQARFDMSEQATILTHGSERGKLLIPGREALDLLLTQQEEDRKPWFRRANSKDKKRLLYLFAATILFFVSTYFLLVPWMAEKMAQYVSVQTEEDFGNSIFNAMALDEKKEETKLINDFFKQMNIQTAYDIRISVVEGEIVNAFALPGGHIVVYTGLLKKLNGYPELAALLGHEFTHVDKRHTTRSIFRKLGSRIFMSLLLGRIGAVTSVLVDQADHLKSLDYSRSLEKEADINGLTLLKERQIDPDGYIRLFESLNSATEGESLPEFLKSHPDIKNRISYIQAAAVGATVNENKTLEEIFEKLK